MKKFYDLYIFDMGEVVIHDIDILTPIRAQLEEKADSFEAHLNLHMRDLLCGTISTTAFWKLFNDKTDSSIDDDLLKTCFNPTEDRKMISLISDLRKNGKRVVCGTNIFEGHYQYLKDRGLFNLFDQIYPSHLMGLAKPDPAYFTMILDKEQISASKTFFTDDLLENTEAARSCGINAVHFQGINALLKSL